MTAFSLKIIASIFMLIDHVGAIFDKPEIFRLIGRSVFPIFAYMIAQGCKHTKNINKYLLRLGVFALISEIPFDLAFHHYFDSPFEVNYFRNTNVFYTLFLGASCVAVYEKLKTKRLSWLISILFLIIPTTVSTTFMFPDISWRIPLSVGFGIYTVAALWLSQALPEMEISAKTMLLRKAFALIATVPIFMLGSILSTDYGMYGVIAIVIFYFAKPENRITRAIAMAFVVFLEYGYPYVYTLYFERGIRLFLLPGKMMFPSHSLYEFQFALAAAILVFLYNGKQGPKVKWAFYAFYPVHIAALGVIWFILNSI